MKPESTDTPWLTIDEFLARNRFTSKTAKIHVMFMARCKRIPGAKKKAGHWVFHREESDKWDEAS